MERVIVAYLSLVDEADDSPFEFFGEFPAIKTREMLESRTSRDPKTHSHRRATSGMRLHSTPHENVSHH